MNQSLDNICAEIARKYGFDSAGLVASSGGPEVFVARFLRNGSLCLAFELDRGRQRASIEDFQTPYSSISQEYCLAKDGHAKVDQFSPFDDGPPWPTKLSVEEWSLRILRYYLEHGHLGYVHE